MHDSPCTKLGICGENPIRSTDCIGWELATTVGELVVARYIMDQVPKKSSHLNVLFGKGLYATPTLHLSRGGLAFCSCGIPECVGPRNYSHKRKTSMDSHDCDGLSYGFFIVASFDVELVHSIG